MSFYFLFSQNPVVSTLTEQFNGSGGVKLGPDGFLYVADFGTGLSNANGSQVWRINPASGERTLFASGFQGASGNDFDSQGNLFQSNIAGRFISKITPSGSVSTFTNVGIAGPVGIAIDDEDNLFVCNCGNNTIRKVTPQGISTLFSSGTIYNCPNGITFDHEGNLYVSNFGNSTIIKITPQGNTTFFASVPGSNNGHLTYFEPDAMLYVNSHGSSSIYTITLGGTVTKIAGAGQRGNADGMAMEATFSRPNGIALSTTGDTLWLNSSIPTVDNPSINFFPLNPSVVRMITGLKENPSAVNGQQGPGLPLVKMSPNPAAILVEIEWELPVQSQIGMTLFTLQGNEVQSFDFGNLPGGAHQKEVDVSDLPSGIYVLSLVGEEFSVNKKFVVSR